ncbi:MAG TPA: hypothetical protein VEV84_16015 [Pyrinomonadaceae bacterium]|nr:hypothetical protein [Pyrinomonadaceae bacterium]
MSDISDVLPIDSLIGMTVLSLSTGNKLGNVREAFVDAVNGLLIGITVVTADGSEASLGYQEIHSFGRDAIMASADDSIKPHTETPFSGHPSAKSLMGTKVVSASGNLLGQIADIFVTVRQPPSVYYELRESMLDKLLGRQLFIPGSAGYALSDDAQRLIVPDETIEAAMPSIAALFGGQISVSSFSPGSPQKSGRLSNDQDDTLVVIADEADETVTRVADEDETVVRLKDEDETVLRWRRRGES